MFAAEHEHNHVLFHLVLMPGISLFSGAFISCCSIFSFQLATLLITMFNNVAVPVALLMLCYLMDLLTISWRVCAAQHTEMYVCS